MRHEPTYLEGQEIFVFWKYICICFLFVFSFIFLIARCLFSLVRSIDFFDLYFICYEPSNCKITQDLLLEQCPQAENRKSTIQSTPER